MNKQAVMKPIKAEITDHGIIQDSIGKTQATVAGSPHAIGFISLGYVNSDVRAVRLDGIEGQRIVEDVHFIPVN